MYLCKLTYIHRHMYIYVYIYTYVHIYASHMYRYSVYVCIHTLKSPCLPRGTGEDPIFTSIYTYMLHICIDIVYIWVYIYICIYVYTHKKVHVCRAAPEKAPSGAIAAVTEPSAGNGRDTHLAPSMQDADSAGHVLATSQAPSSNPMATQ